MTSWIHSEINWPLVEDWWLNKRFLSLWQMREECTEGLRHLGGKVGSGGWENLGGPGGTSQQSALLLFLLCNTFHFWLFLHFLEMVLQSIKMWKKQFHHFIWLFRIPSLLFSFFWLFLHFLEMVLQSKKMWKNNFITFYDFLLHFYDLVSESIYY